MRLRTKLLIAAPVLIALTGLILAQNSAVFPGRAITTSDLFVAANYASSTLLSGVTSSATSISVASGSGFVSPGLYSIDNEIVAVCGVSGNTLTVGKSACPNVDGRGYDNSAAVSHLAGRAVQGRVVAWLHNQLAAETIAVERKLHAENISVVDFGAVGDYSFSTHTGTDNCTPFTNAAAAGGDLYFPPGIYYSSCTITQGSTSNYWGAGRGDDCSSAKTCLVFAAGVTGIINSTTARNSSVKRMWIYSLSSASGSDRGIFVRDSWFTLDGVGISNFGMEGIGAVTDNVDDMRISNSLFVSNKGDGWHCGVTTDCNMIMVDNNAAQNNGGIGFHMEAGGPASFFGNHTATNTTRDFDLNGNSLDVRNPYCENGGVFYVRAVYSRIVSPNGGGCTITNLGGPSTVIFTSSIISSGVWFGPDTWPSAPTRSTNYAFRSGHFASGDASLWDDTDSRTIWHYDPVADKLTFDRTVAFSVNSAFSSPLTSYEASSGGGAYRGKLLLDAQNGSGTEKTYASLQAYISANTAGSENGDACLFTMQAGTLTCAFTFDHNGIVKPSKTYTVGTLPSCSGYANGLTAVTDASTPSYLGSVSGHGGGSTWAPVGCTPGGSWVFY